MRLLVALLLSAVVLAGCAANAHGLNRDAGTLVALVRVDAGTMNPLYGQTAADNQYQSLVYDSLVLIGEGYLPKPALATSWTRSPDGLHWTVDLRHGVRWSDGEPFTSKDVVFSYNMMRDPKTAFNGSSDVECIKSMTALGPYRVRFDLGFVTARFVLATMNLSIFPEHIAGKLAPDRQRFSSLGEHPVGTGPYMMERWQHDSEAVFVRNSYYWRGKVNIPRIDYRVIFNDQAQVDAVEEGSADLIDDISFTNYKRFRNEAPQIKLLTFPALYVNTLELNNRRPGLSDLNVRRAMMYGFNRKAISDGFTDGQTQVADSIVAPALTAWYDTKVPKYPYDPDKARTILDDAGWKAGPEGVRAKGATRLAFEMMVNQGSAVLLDELMGFQADMKAIGIDVAVRQMDFATLVARSYKGQYDIDAASRGGILDPDWTALFDSKQVPPTGANTLGYSNPAVDYDLRTALRTLDDRKRREYYDHMQTVVAQTLPLLYMTTRFSGIAYSPRLVIDPKTTIQLPYLYYNVADWKLTQ